jgi:broad specificity phosphatase PhoE
VDTQPSNTIYMIRHGENPANITHEFSYKRVDYSLTSKGILQAQQTGEYFKDKQIDEIYASPLKRTRETASYIAQALDLPVTIMEQFREINVGSLEGQPPTDENWELHNRIIREWASGEKDLSFPNGENYYQLLERLRDGLKAVTEHKVGKRIVIVAHGGIITHPLRDICPNQDLSAAAKRGNYNCSITQIELSTANGQLQGKLQMWASATHLHGVAAQVGEGAVMAEHIPATKQI